MSTYGLQVFDDNGVKTLDTSYRLTRSIATLTVSHSGGQISTFISRVLLMMVLGE